MDHHNTQASVPAGLVNTGIDPAPSPVVSVARCTEGNGQTSVLVDLLKQVKPLLSESPEEIMRFFIRMEEIQTLGLVDD